MSKPTDNADGMTSEQIEALTRPLGFAVVSPTGVVRLFRNRHEATEQAAGPAIKVRVVAHPDDWPSPPPAGTCNT